MKPNCNKCKHYWPKGSTAFNYEVCNFQFKSVPVRTLKECPAKQTEDNGK